MEDVVHHRLERRRAVRQAKEHDQGLEQAAVRAESCLPFIAFTNAHVVEPPTHV